MIGRGDRDGPVVVPAHVQTRNVPEQKLCDGCRYFDSRIVGNVCGGFGGRVGPTTTECRHPDAMIYLDAPAPGDQIPLRTSDRGTPRVISRDAGFGCNATPEWCPFLVSKKN